MQISSESIGKRLDVVVSELLGVTRSAAQGMIDGSYVTVNGRIESKNYRLRENDDVEIEEQELKELSVEAENIPLDIIFEDEDIIVINKPSGMVVHPAPGNESGTLVNALLYHCKGSLSGINGVVRPGIVHRIDKDTSGLLVVAKNDESHVFLSSLLKDHGIKRVYHAIVVGHYKENKGTVNAPIGRHPVDRKKMAVLLSPASHAKEAVTHYEVIENFGDISYVKARLETGRTHQIRVHMSHIGHALIGDEVYGGGKIRFEKLHASLLDGQILHAKKLVLTHPRTKEKMEFEAPLPKNFEKLLKILKNAKD